MCADGSETGMYLIEQGMAYVPASDLQSHGLKRAGGIGCPLASHHVL